MTVNLPQRNLGGINRLRKTTFVPGVTRECPPLPFMFCHVHHQRVGVQLRVKLPGGIRGSTPEPQIFPLSQFQPGNQRIQVNNLIAALEGIMPVQQNVLPGNR